MRPFTVLGYSDNRVGYLDEYIYNARRIDWSLLYDRNNFYQLRVLSELK